jgi:uncharacterized membrane protein HdeD (DUF308 family)
MNQKDRLTSPDESYSGIFLFFGLALVALGVVAIASAVLFTISTVMIFGALLMAAGVAELINAFRTKERSKILLNVLSAIVYLAAGSLLIWNPIAGALTLTLVVAAFLFAAGVLRIVKAIQRRKNKDWGLFLLGGIIDLALGFIIASGWPISGLWVIGLFVGVEMIVHGIAWIVLGTSAEPIEAQAVS